MTWLYWLRLIFLIALIAVPCWLGYLAWVHDHE